MKISQIAYTLIGGMPVVAYVGILTLVLLFSTATIGYLSLHGKINGFKYHFILAKTTITVALIHALLAISAYLNF